MAPLKTGKARKAKAPSVKKTPGKSRGGSNKKKTPAALKASSGDPLLMKSKAPAAAKKPGKSSAASCCKDDAPPLPATAADAP